MESLQPLTRKVDHIEGFRFHPEDVQNEIFDVIVNEMKIFAGVDEHGEKCEYMYILSDKKELHKMKMMSRETHEQLQNELMKCEKSTTTGLIKDFKNMIHEFTDTIPLSPVEKFAWPLHHKYERYFGNFYYFKCRKARFTYVFVSLVGDHLKQFLPKNGQILTDIDDYLLFHKNKIVNCGFELNTETGKSEESGLGRITNEDIQKGNEILRKVIDYLEKK